MIFVTVGTHEQPFDRLIKYMDQWAGEHDEKVVIQTGCSDYTPTRCVWKSMFSYSEMVEYMKEARIIISHGGPASFMKAIQLGKTPIVVPRRKKYGEHVNDHQLYFCKEVSEKKCIILITMIEKLSKMIDEYDDLVVGLYGDISCNNEFFVKCFSSIIRKMGFY